MSRGRSDNSQVASSVPFDNSNSNLIEPSDSVQESTDSLVSSLKYGREVYIKEEGDDITGDGSIIRPFATLTGVKNALDSGDLVTPLSVNCDGFTIDQDPVDFSAYTEILIKGNGPRTRFNATNPNADLLILGASQSLRSVSFQGVTNSNNWLVKFSATGSGVGSVDDVFFTSGSNAFTVTNTTGIFRITLTASLSTNMSGTYFEVNDNSVLTVNGATGVGNSTSTLGVVQNGSGQFFGFTLRLTNYFKGIQINGNSSGLLELQAVSLVNNSTSIEQSSGTLTPIRVLNCDFDASKSIITDTSIVEGFFFNEIETEKQVRFISELSVGLPNRGNETVLGQGDSYVNGMQVYTFNGTSFVDISSSARSVTGSTFTYPNNLTNSAIYISTAFDQSNPLKWFGIKCLNNTAASLGTGDLVFEYWNGSIWVEFNHMYVESNVPYQSFANSKFEQTGSYQILFDKRLETNWQVNDPVSLGVNLYWIRIRIDSPLNTLPVFEQFKIHTSRFEIEDNGFQNMYGTGRITERFPIGLSGLNAVVGRGPNSQDVYLSDNLAAAINSNSFPSNQPRSEIFNAFIPFEVDTSCPIELVASYQISNTTAGTAVFRIRWATALDGDSIYTSSSDAPATSPNERTVTGSVTFGTNENQTIKTFRQNLEIPEAITQSTSGTARARLWVLIERIPNDPSDNYNGDIILDDLTVFYTAFREGGYSGDFT